MVSVAKVHLGELDRLERTDQGRRDPAWWLRYYLPHFFPARFGRFHVEIIQSFAEMVEPRAMRAAPEPADWRLIDTEPDDGEELSEVEWDELAKKDALDRVARSAAWACPREHGKCLAAGTLVQRADGSLVPIETWAGGELVSLNPTTLRFDRAWSPAAVPNGRKRVIELRLRTGRMLRLTPSHRLLGVLGWMEAGTLRLGDRIAVGRTLSGLGSHVLPDGEAWLLGLLVGDGGLTGGGVRLSSADQGVVDEAMRIVCGRGWRFHGVGAPYNWAIVGRKGARSGGPKHFLRSHGLSGKLSGEKRVPTAIWSAPDHQIAEFLAGYFDADGSANHRRNGSAEFYSISRELLIDVQALLVRLGIAAVLTPKRGRYKGQPHASWRLTVRGDDLRALVMCLPCKSRKREDLRYAAKPKSRRGGWLHAIPPEWRTLLRVRGRAVRRAGPRIDNHYATTRAKVADVAAIDDNPRLHALATSDVIWDEVVEIADAGVAETYDLTVPGHACFLANGVVSHNSTLLVGLALWAVVYRLRRYILFISDTKPQANDRLLEALHELEANERLLEDFGPQVGDAKWTSDDAITTGGVRLRALGMRSKVRGAKHGSHRPDLAICDDLENDEHVLTEQQRHKGREWLTKALIPAIDSDIGVLIVLGTIIHHDSLLARLVSAEHFVTFRKRVYRALNRVGDLIRSLWPSRWPVPKLLAKKEEIGSIAFGSEYLNEPVSDETSIFRLEWLTQCKRPGLAFAETYEAVKERLGGSAPLVLVQGWDFGWVDDRKKAEEKDSNYTVGWSVAVHAMTRHRYLVRGYRARGLSPKEIRAGIKSEAGPIRPDPVECPRFRVAVENVGLQKQLYDVGMREESDLPIAGVLTGAEKSDIYSGVPMLSAVFEGAQYHLPWPSAENIDETYFPTAEAREAEARRQRDLVQALINELWGLGKEAHDDTVMALWFTEVLIRRMLRIHDQRCREGPAGGSDPSTPSSGEPGGDAEGGGRSFEPIATKRIATKPIRG